ncbi:MAG: hypothetical protein M1821_008400 [Bathelium mastoideum]|nr:MAG: hypothetical protein M1821_008400 [Bathelium mastoideum]
MRIGTLAFLFASLTAGTLAMVHPHAHPRVHPRGELLQPRQMNQTNGTCHAMNSVKLTFFGWPDNTPPSANAAYNCGRGYVSGGSGTHDDPVTIATAEGELKICDVVYIPYLKKYGVFNGKCQQCMTDWQQGQKHFDIWTGSSQEGGNQDQIECERQLTPGDLQTVIRYPPKDLDVNPGPTYDMNSQPTCHKQTQTFPQDNTENVQSLCH